MKKIKLFEGFLNESASDECKMTIMFGKDQEKFVDAALGRVDKKYVKSSDKSDEDDMVKYVLVFTNTYGAYLFGHEQATSADERKRELNNPGK